MGDIKIELLRRYGYDITINRFEPLLRKIMMNEVLILNYGLKNWQNEIPQGVIKNIIEEKEITLNNIDIEDFFEELYLWSLKEIAVYSDHYKHLICLTGDLSKERFIELMDELNEVRKKIAHAKSTFTKLDLARLIEIVKEICQGEIAEELIKFINNESYKSADEIPPNFFSEYACPNNLPIEEYDLDGGFVGRRKEIEKIRKLLYSDQDRIITITGAGGVGKTAVALKTAYNILSDENNPFDAIIWFSAKEKKLIPDRGIVPIESDIKSCEQMVKDILNIVDNQTLQLFERSNMPRDKYKEHLHKIFSSQKCLLIIDNLETIKDEETVHFIKDIPRPSQVLITSRKGLGEIERRYPLPNFSEKDAKTLFRLIAKERERIDLLMLSDETIGGLTKKVRYYPLLIKWSIGKVFLGKDILEAFTEIYSGKSEIAEFVFNDIFKIFSQPAKLCLYSMIIIGDKPISKHLLMHLANLDDDTFDDAIRELTITSFVYPGVSDTSEGIVTNYQMLSLTRGFVTYKLDEDSKTLRILQTRYYDLSRQIELLEKSQSEYNQALFSLGVKTEEEKIAFNYVKTAKNYIKTENFEKGTENFENAIEIAPNFSYALIEYAKFEFYRGHIPKSNELFQRSVDADKENFHAFFSFGNCLKRQKNLADAINMFKEAQRLNPDYLPIYNELGRVYSFDGKYEKANEQFEKAAKQQKYPNYMHNFITLKFKADNYKRWSVGFFKRNDHQEGFSKLYQALSAIEEANQIKKGDRVSILLEKKICKQIAINLCEIGKFEDSIPYFNRCFNEIQMLDGSTLNSDPEMADAYHYFDYYGLKKLKMGTIERYNVEKHYGIIRSKDETYLFVLNGFDKRLEQDEINSLEGRNVAFNIDVNPDPKKKNSPIAVNIRLEVD